MALGAQYNENGFGLKPTERSLFNLIEIFRIWFLSTKGHVLHTDTYFSFHTVRQSFVVIYPWNLKSEFLNDLV